MFLFILTAIVTLAACGSGEKVTLESEEDGMSQTITFNAKKDKIEKVEMKVTQSYDSLGLGSKDEVEEAMGGSFEAEFEEVNNTDGLEANVDYQDEELVIEAKVDFTKVDTDNLDELNVGFLPGSFDDEDLSLEKAVSELESQGFKKVD